MVNLGDLGSSKRRRFTSRYWVGEKKKRRGEKRRKSQIAEMPPFWSFGDGGSKMEKSTKDQRKPISKESHTVKLRGPLEKK